MVDWTKPIQTRSGHKARYLGSLIGGLHVVAIRDNDSHETLLKDWGDGCWIINVPEPERER